MQYCNSFDFKLSDWEMWCREHGEASYRAKQIYAWHFEPIADFAEMSNLSLKLRQKLAEQFRFGGMRIIKVEESAKDDTAKLVLELSDGHVIETVRMTYQHGISACLSTQAGCRMGCKFCASASCGYGRNLTVGEMMSQVALHQRLARKRIGGVVLMGIGEPLDNYDNTIEFLRRLGDADGFNIGMRHISVSTCGLVPEMLKLAEERLPVTLSVSLHAPNQAIREQLMPIAKKYEYEEVLNAMEVFNARTGRRITVEYALFAGINDLPHHATELAQRLHGMALHINLIPANPIPGLQFRRPSNNAIRSFAASLESAGLNVTIRRELGSDIEAACGQLRRSMRPCQTE